MYARVLGKLHVTHKQHHNNPGSLWIGLLVCTPDPVVKCLMTVVLLWWWRWCYVAVVLDGWLMEAAMLKAPGKVVRSCQRYKGDNRRGLFLANLSSLSFCENVKTKNLNSTQFKLALVQHSLLSESLNQWIKRYVKWEIFLFYKDF